MPLSEREEFELLSLERERASSASAKSASESPYSLKNLAGAAVEPNLALASGAIAAPISGLAGLATAAGRAVGLTNKEPADVVRSVGSAMSYAPRTQGGQTATDVITKPFQWLQEGADVAGGKVTDAAARTMPAPMAAALGANANAALQMAAPMALAKGVRSVVPSSAETSMGPQAQLLAEKGVTMTPGQRRGGMIGTLEQSLQSIPFLGDLIKSSRGEATKQFNTAVLNDALAPVAETLPEGLSGHKAVQHIREKLSEKYDTLLPQMQGSLDSRPQVGGNQVATPTSPRPPSLREELDTIKSMGNNLPRQQRKDLTRIIDEDVIGKFTPNGGLAMGETIKEIQTHLNKEAAAYGRGGVYEQKVANALKEAGSAIRDMLRRENPDLAPELQKIDTAYGKFKIIQKAAEYGTEGTFTPSELVKAIRSKDTTLDKRAYTEGEAGRGMQPLAEAGKAVLPSKLPESGTVQRGLVAHAVLGGALGNLVNPYSAIAAAVVPSIYNRMTLRALQQMQLDPMSGGYLGAQAAPFGAMEQANQKR